MIESYIYSNRFFTNYGIWKGFIIVLKFDYREGLDELEEENLDIKK